MFDTEEKQKAAVSAFVVLINSEGWKLLEQIWDENITVIREQLDNGTENETIEDVKRMRDKIKLLKEVRNTPAVLIEKLTPNKIQEYNPDPYETLEEFQARKNIDS